LAEHENAEHRLSAGLAQDLPETASKVQLTMFTPVSQKIAERLREADLDRLTPLEALTLLHDLKKDLKS
jgi:DNA mismatch repair protein MutS